MNQRIAAVKYYYTCNGNQSMAARCLAQEFNINPPQGRSIQSVVETFEATGLIASVKKKKYSHPKTATNVAKAEEVNPKKSTCCLSAELEVSQSSIICILHQKNLTFHVYCMPLMMEMMTAVFNFVKSS